MRLPQKIVAQRDNQIYEAKMMGMSYRQIADAFSISPSTAHSAYMRAQKTRARMGQAEAIDSVWTHIDQLDRLVFSLSPMTRAHKVTTEAGHEIEVPPDMDAINTLLKVLGQKAKIMGYEKDVITLQMAGQQSAPGIGSGAKSSAELTPEQLAKELGAEMLKAGVLSGPIAKVLEQAIVDSAKAPEDEFEVEVLEDSNDVLQLSTGYAEEDSDVPPPWVDEEDQEYIPGAWMPDDPESGDSYAH